MAVETEVKFYLPDLQAVQTKLEALGAVLRKPRLFERNLRYDDAANSLTSAHIVLRLRQDDRVRLTYKGTRLGGDAKLHSREELETEVSDFAVMDAILKRLGYHVSWAYEKYRTTYALEAAEIVLDETPFGNFIEIEGEAEAIERIIAALGLADAKRILSSYAELFLLVKEALGLAFQDMTFANFAGISVSGELFS